MADRCDHCGNRTGDGVTPHADDCPTRNEEIRERAERAEETMAWTPASTPPPEEGDCRKLVVIVQDEMRYVGIRAYNHLLAKWFANGGEEPGEVTHWMDLPEPPL